MFGTGMMTRSRRCGGSTTWSGRSASWRVVSAYSWWMKRINRHQAGDQEDDDQEVGCLALVTTTATVTGQRRSRWR